MLHSAFRKYIFLKQKRLLKYKLVKKISIYIICLLLGILIIFPKPIMAQMEFPKLPYEDPVNGRNSNAFSSAIGKPANDSERQAFIDQIKPLAIAAQAETKIPACAIGGMAALESGYGFTRIAQFANNIFAIKEWVNHDTPTSWQLKGQPDEDGEAVKIIKNNGDDRLVFEENNRRDNRYRKFSSFAEAVSYLTKIKLQQENYKPALEHYLKNRQDLATRYADDPKQKSTIPVKSCNTYLFEIAEIGGYYHCGGYKYLTKIIPIMERWKLYEWSE